MSNFKKNTFWILILIVISDLFFLKIPIEFLFATLLFCQFLFVDRISNAFLLLTFAPIVYGAFFFKYNINYLGGASLLIGLVLIIPYLERIKQHSIRNYIYFFLLMVLFFFSIFFKENFHLSKLTEIIINGTRYYLAFTLLLFFKNKINFKILSLIFLYLSAFSLRLSIDVMDLDGPQNIFDFGFMRDQSYSLIIYNLNSINEKLNVISYHLPGFLALISISFLINTKIKTNKTLYIVISLLIILYAGAKQNILGLVLLFLIYYLFGFKSSFKLKAVFLFFVTFTLIFIYNNYYLDFISSFSVFDFSQAQ